MVQVVAGAGLPPKKLHRGMVAPTSGNSGQFLIDFQPGAYEAEQFAALLGTHTAHEAERFGPGPSADAGDSLRSAARAI